MCFARSVWVIRNSVRHFRIVFPGASERVISPAIFSRKTLCTSRGQDSLYIRMSNSLSAICVGEISVCDLGPEGDSEAPLRSLPQLELDVASMEQGFAPQ